jgi:hypothetical protein
MVRSADIRTKHGVTNRPITKWYPLEGNSETADTDSVTEECVNSDNVDESTPCVSSRPFRQAANRARALLLEQALNG